MVGHLLHHHILTLHYLDEKNDDSFNIAECCTRFHVETELLFKVSAEVYCSDETVDVMTNSAYIVFQCKGTGKNHNTFLKRWR